MSAPAPRSASQSSPSRVLEETEGMPFTLADLDAIYRDPTPTLPEPSPPPPEPLPQPQQPKQKQKQPKQPKQPKQQTPKQPKTYAPRRNSHKRRSNRRRRNQPPPPPPQIPCADPHDLEQDLNALQETLEKDMLEMQGHNAFLGAPAPDLDDPLELQEIMVDDVVASEVVLSDDLFDRIEMLDDDLPDSIQDFH